MKIRKTHLKHYISCNFECFRPPRKYAEEWMKLVEQHQGLTLVSFLCDLHFEAEDLIEIRGKVTLKNGAKPSIFPQKGPPKSYVFSLNICWNWIYNQLLSSEILYSKRIYFQ